MMAVLIAIYYDGANSLIFKPDSVNELVSTVPLSCTQGSASCSNFSYFYTCNLVTPASICCVKYNLTAASRLPKMFPAPLPLNLELLIWKRKKIYRIFYREIEWYQPTNQIMRWSSNFVGEFITRCCLTPYIVLYVWNEDMMRQSMSAPCWSPSSNTQIKEDELSRGKRIQFRRTQKICAWRPFSQ
jgi:hypothetical protein